MLLTMCQCIEQYHPGQTAQLFTIIILAKTSLEGPVIFSFASQTSGDMLKHALEDWKRKKYKLATILQHPLGVCTWPSVHVVQKLRTLKGLTWQPVVVNHKNDTF